VRRLRGGQCAVACVACLRGESDPPASLRPQLPPRALAAAAIGDCVRDPKMGELTREAVLEPARIQILPPSSVPLSKSWIFGEPVRGADREGTHVSKRQRQHTSAYVSIRQKRAPVREAVLECRGEEGLEGRDAGVPGTDDSCTIIGSPCAVVGSCEMVSSLPCLLGGFSKRQHTSAYVSFRQHPSAYVRAGVMERSLACLLRESRESRQEGWCARVSW
jgi:hypothetical protein